MSSMSKSSSDPAVDLEKGVTGLETVATEEEDELVVVNPCIAMCIKATLGVLVVAHTLFIIYITVRTAKVSDNWWDIWPIVVVFTPIFTWTLWRMPKAKESCVRKYATKHRLPSDSDATTKLLASTE